MFTQQITENSCRTSIILIKYSLQTTPVPYRQYTTLNPKLYLNLKLSPQKGTLDIIIYMVFLSLKETKFTEENCRLENLA